MNGFTFFISRIRVEILAPPELLHHLRILFAACTQPLVPTCACVRYEVDSHGELTVDGQPLKRIRSERNLLHLVEINLFIQLKRRHGDLIALHAAAFSWQGRGMLLVGPSGAGKSTLTREALRRGAVYYSDDMVFFDGRVLWGVPRAIRLDPIRSDWSPDPGDWELLAWGLTPSEDHLGLVPTYRVTPSQVAPAPMSAKDTLILFPHRTSRAERMPLSSSETLAGLYEAIVGELRSDGPDIGKLVSPRCGSRLYWNDAVRALDALEGKAPAG